MANWNPHDQPVNKFILDDYVSPGICQQPKNAAVKRKLDERLGYGIDRAFLIYTGRELAKFVTEILLVTREDWRYWRETFQPMIHSVPRRGPVRSSNGGYEPGKSHLIWHPQLIVLEITQCVVEVEPQETIDEYGVGHVPLEFRQVVPMPKAAYARPEAPQQDKPLNEDQKEIKRLTDVLSSKRQANEMAGR